MALAGCCRDTVVYVTTVSGCNLVTNEAGKQELVCTDITQDTVALGGGDTVAVGGGDSLPKGVGN